MDHPLSLQYRKFEDIKDSDEERAKEEFDRKSHFHSPTAVHYNYESDGEPPTD